MDPATPVKIIVIRVVLLARVASFYSSIELTLSVNKLGHLCFHLALVNNKQLILLLQSEHGLDLVFIGIGLHS
jgi:hypothetical protein